tara:strand:+ start:366 stop:512 length:147 start_codon:yes stop_codon:yes gene_type:complete
VRTQTILIGVALIWFFFLRKESQINIGGGASQGRGSAYHRFVSGESYL